MIGLSILFFGLGGLFFWMPSFYQREFGLDEAGAAAVGGGAGLVGILNYLHVDPVSGFYTRLVFAQEGWSDHRLAHHPCYEEAYTVQGHMEYNFGTLDLGTYFFRPARVKHGHFTTMEGGATWLLRSDGELLNWYTQGEGVRWGGEATAAPSPARCSRR